MTTRMQQHGCHDNHYMNFLVVMEQKYNGVVAMETVLKFLGCHGNKFVFPQVSKYLYSSINNIGSTAVAICCMQP